jgi:Protein of unknown function (DUF4231)
MSGTQLDVQLDVIKQYESLQYEDIGAFCRIAFTNRAIAYLSGMSYSHVERLRELAEILEGKIKEDTYDEEAIQIARKLFEEEEGYFLTRLYTKKVKFEKSVRRQIAKYRWAAWALKLTQQLLLLAVIIGAAIVPLLLSDPTSPREVSKYISIGVAVSAALLQFYKFQEHINFHNTAAEKMDLEYSHYLTGRDIYEDLNTGAALDRFMDEIDKLRKETNELSLTLEKTAQDQMQDQILRVSKSIPETHHIKDAQ